MCKWHQSEIKLCMHTLKFGMKWTEKKIIMHTTKAYKPHTLCSICKWKVKGQNIDFMGNST